MYSYYLKGFSRSLSILLVVLLISCSADKNEQENTFWRTNNVLPPNTGRVSEIVVVASDQLWDRQLDSIVRSIFQANIPALPQKEAFFDLYRINPESFSNIYKTHKNILNISLGENSSIKKLTGVWSKDQLFVNLVGATEQKIIESLRNNSSKIMSWYLNKDCNRRLVKLSSQQEIRTKNLVSESFGLDMTIPKGFFIAEKENGFVWLRKDQPKKNIISNIWLYAEDYHSPEQLSKRALVLLRDSIGKAHVEGNNEHSFMRTELLYEPLFSVLQENPYMVELSGLWTMENGFLGGPFISRTILNKQKNKIIYVEGFLYCPNERKRSYIFDLDAVLSSIKIK